MVNLTGILRFAPEQMTGREGQKICLFSKCIIVFTMDSLVSMLNNKIPDGYYILAYTYIPDTYSNPANLYASWPSSLFTAFQNLGATSFTPGMPDDGFIFFVKKEILISSRDSF